MLNRLKRAMTPVTADEDGNRRMQEIFQADIVESKRGDIRAKFDPGFIPGVHANPNVRPTGPEGWINGNGELVPFDHYQDEISPESLDANVEEEVV